MGGCDGAEFRAAIAVRGHDGDLVCGCGLNREQRRENREQRREIREQRSEKRDQRREKREQRREIREQRSGVVRGSFAARATSGGKFEPVSER
jgi:hypothetical protein